jgi:spore coat protein H
MNETASHGPSSAPRLARAKVPSLLLWTLLFVLLPTSAFAAPKAPKAKRNDASDALFATNAPIFSFNIQVSGAELTALQNANRNYARGSVTIGTNVFNDVGVHLKGNGSFRPLHEKPSLVIKFDRYLPDQEFCGLTKIALNSSSQDATYLADFTANSLFRDANVPVSRVTHARVTLNQRPLGLYVLVEAHNKEFLKRWFRNSQGNLYEAYLADVDSQMDQDNGNDTTQNDRKRLADIVKIPEAAERWAKLPQVLDVDRYVSHLVCELFTAHTDGYAMNRNNYRIYHDPADGRFTFFGHGVDWGFQNTGVSIRPPLNSLVTRAVMNTPEGAKLFKERLGTLFTNAFRLELLTNRVNVAVARLVSQAKDTNEAKEFLRYGTEMNNRLVARWQNITNQYYGVPAVVLAFDREGIAKLSGWRKKTDRTSPPMLHEQTVDGSRHVLCIRTTTNAPSVGSWRTKVLLPPGQYVFEGDLRGAGIIAQTNQIGLGAGLRISQGKREARLVGDAPWTHMQQDINIEGMESDVELVCELRATHGEVWFDQDSLRLRKRK